MKYRRTYVSGPITGSDDYEARFSEAIRFLQKENEEIAKTYPFAIGQKLKTRIFINPVEENKKRFSSVTEEPIWSDYMREDIKLLCDCDEIYMMKGWEKSKGARAEKRIAEMLGLTIRYEKGAVRMEVYNASI